MKILTSAQIRELDKYTIEHEPITSLDLMERAAESLSEEIMKHWDSSTPVVVFAGPGNNGGDALAIARMLLEEGYSVSTYLFNVKGKLSSDCEANYERLQKKHDKSIQEVRQEFDPPQLNASTLVVDGLFGSGLNKPLSGGFASVVRYINASDAQVVSIDVPSGLMTEDNTFNVRQNIIKADRTFTLGMKKLCMMMPDNQQYIGKLKVLDIGLSQEFIDKADAQFRILEDSMVTRLIKPRDPFAHKGTMGHALLVSGRYGMAGAAVLAAKACLRSGTGKVTVHTPKRNNDILQISIPEAIVSHDRHDEMISYAPHANDYNAVGIGPGIGTDDITAVAVMTLLRNANVPVVVDADALNILATHKAWMQQLPAGLIYTPHPGEMNRLCDTPPTDDYDRLMKARDMAQRLRGYVILKGHYSALCLPDGQVLFNSTGNAGMATAGSGDVLTGIITSLLAQGYSAFEAAVIGMYAHGAAGDRAAKKLGMSSLIASDIIENLRINE
ncbi:MAG: NAD(P)H-hydrate dehydratase [Prevotella sp.]|nr:NAD(P)H-hydrate dehydratase [Candidatus Prevotella equi]